MPIRLSDLSRDYSSCRVEVDGNAVEIVYRPSGLTPAVLEHLSEQIAAGRGWNALADALAACLVSWDVLDDDGHPLPPTAENLRRLPIGFLSRVFNAIFNDMSPKLTSESS